MSANLTEELGSLQDVIHPITTKVGIDPQGYVMTSCTT